MQPEFVAELFRLLKAEGIHTALDTSGIGTAEGIAKVLEYTDLVLADLKFENPDDYIAEFTGETLRLYLEDDLNSYFIYTKK